MDFVSVWKAISIVLTGTFGILGLLKDFKDKDGKITGWGKVSLVGILLSSSLGVIAQFKDISNQEKASEKRARETLSLVQNTDQAVRDIQRTLVPLDGPKFNIFFSASCTDPNYIILCRDTPEGNRIDEKNIFDWSDFVDQVIYMDLFRDPIEAKTFIQGGSNHPDLQLFLDAKLAQGTLRISHDSDRVLIEVRDCAPSSERYSDRPYSNGKITSAVDLSGATVVVTARRNQVLLPDFELTGFLVRLGSGQEFGIYTLDSFKAVAVDQSAAESGNDERGFQLTLSERPKYYK